MCQTPRGASPPCPGAPVAWRLAAALLCALAGTAHAQVSGSVAAVSDYRYRGASLSQERPAASLSLSYDHGSGFYAGAKVIVAKPPRNRTEVMGYMDYAGFAAPGPGRTSFDVGLINYNLTSYRFGRRTVDYTEAYAGLVGEHLSVHLHYAPDYYQSGVRTLYADLSGGFRPAPRLKLFGHIGVLTPVGGRNRPGSRKERYDLKAGAAVDLGQAEVSLSWTHLAPPYVPQSRGGERANRLAAGIAYFF